MIENTPNNGIPLHDEIMKISNINDYCDPRAVQKLPCPYLGCSRLSGDQKRKGSGLCPRL